MALVYQDGRRPTLHYNFSADGKLPAEKGTHRVTGRGRAHRLPSDLVTGTIRALDMPINSCSTAKVTQ
jgi:hypothetical protein